MGDRDLGLALVAFFAISQVMQVQLPLVPFNLEQIGVIACTLMAVAMGMRIRWSWLLFAFALLEFSYQSIHAIYHVQPVPVAISLLRTSILFLAASILREMVLRDQSAAIGVLARAWIITAGVSAALVWLQFAGLLPSYVLRDGQLQIQGRPSGLQNDPNYAAYTFVAAMALMWTTGWPGRWRAPVAGMLFAALAFTESRMGLILLLVTLVYLWFPKSRRLSREGLLGRFVVAGLGIGVVTTLLAAFLFSRETTGAFGGLFLLERFYQAAESLDGLSLSRLELLRGYQGDSARERVMLAFAGIRVWQQNFWIGVGDQLVFEIGHIIGVRKAPHNAYIDRLAIGGVMGLAFIGFLLFVGLRTVAVVGGAEPAVRQTAVALLAIVAFGGVFLNLSFWAPLALLSVCFTLRAPAGRGRGAASARASPARPAPSAPSPPEPAR